jgi:hypothetical protein
LQCVSTGEDAAWEDGGNREFTIWGPDFSLDIRCRWNLTDDTEIQAAALPKNGQANFPTLASLRASDLEAEEAAELLRAKLKSGKRSLAGSGSSNGSSNGSNGRSSSSAAVEGNGVSQRERDEAAERRARKEQEAWDREQQQEKTEAQRVLAAAAASSNGSSSYSSPEVGGGGRGWQGV